MESNSQWAVSSIPLVLPLSVKDLMISSSKLETLESSVYLKGLTGLLTNCPSSHLSSVQSLSFVRFLATPWIAARPPCPSPTPRIHPNPCLLCGDAIQPSHPLSSPSPPALNLSQHQDLFKWVSSLHQVAKVLEFQLQHQSFQWTPRIDLL